MTNYNKLLSEKNLASIASRIKKYWWLGVILIFALMIHKAYTSYIKYTIEVDKAKMELEMKK